MPCCDDPGCECNNPVCSECGEELFGWEEGPACDLCTHGSDDEDGCRDGPQ